MIKYICDSCGKDVGKGGLLYKETFIKNSASHRLDLCPQCKSELEKEISEEKTEFIIEKRKKYGLEPIF